MTPFPILRIERIRFPLPHDSALRLLLPVWASRYDSVRMSMQDGCVQCAILCAERAFVMYPLLIIT